MDESKVRELLRKRCESAGGLRIWARGHQISPGHVSRVINGEKLPGTIILKALGLKSKTVYYAVR